MAKCECQVCCGRLVRRHIAFLALAITGMRFAAEGLLKIDPTPVVLKLAAMSETFLLASAEHGALIKERI